MILLPARSFSRADTHIALLAIGSQSFSGPVQPRRVVSVSPAEKTESAGPRPLRGQRAGPWVRIHFAPANSQCEPVVFPVPAAWLSTKEQRYDPTSIINEVRRTVDVCGHCRSQPLAPPTIFPFPSPWLDIAEQGHAVSQERSLLQANERIECSPGFPRPHDKEKCKSQCLCVGRAAGIQCDQPG